jgi:general stress protein 26
VTPEKSEEHLYELIKDFDTGILITRSGGKLHGRPMAVASVEDSGAVYFPTSDGSPKANEIEADPAVMTTFQSGYKFVSLNGQAQIVRDRVLIGKMWSEAWRVWFPGGKDDPTLCLIRVAPTDGEFWDTSGSEAVKYAYRAAKAYVKGEKPEIDPNQNAKVRL